MKNGGRTVRKVYVQLCHCRETAGVPAVTALLMREEENLCCRVGPVAVRLVKSTMVHG